MIFIISVPKAQRGTGHTGAEQPGGCWSQKKMRQSIACKVNLNQPAPGGAGRRACPTARASIFQGIPQSWDASREGTAKDLSQNVSAQLFQECSRHVKTGSGTRAGDVPSSVRAAQRQAEARGGLEDTPRAPRGVCRKLSLDSSCRQC